MDLSGRFVHFWLSPAGKEALSEVIHGGPDFEALVVDDDSIGLWLWIPMRSTSREKSHCLNGSISRLHLWSTSPKCRRKNLQQALDSRVKASQTPKSLGAKRQWRKRNLIVISRTATWG